VELRPRPRWGSLQRSHRPHSWIQGGLLLRRGEGRGGESMERGQEGRGWEGKRGEGNRWEGREGEGSVVESKKSLK